MDPISTRESVGGQASGADHGHGGQRRRRRRSNSSRAIQHRARQFKKFLVTAIFVVAGSALTVWVAVYLAGARQ